MNITFCGKLCKLFTETLKTMRNAYGDQCIERNQCYGRFKHFQNDRMSVDHCSGRLSTSTDDAHVTKVNAIVRSNRHFTVREIMEDFNISVGSCHEILTEKFGTHRIAAKFVRPFDIRGYNVKTNIRSLLFYQDQKKTRRIRSNV